MMITREELLQRNAGVCCTLLMHLSVVLPFFGALNPVRIRLTRGNDDGDNDKEFDQRKSICRTSPI